MESKNIIHEADVVSEDDGEEEEDFEGYFLKPANEYDIHEKIKEANQELYLEMQQHPIDQSGDSSTLARKVTFRANLEEYEPEELSRSHSSLESIAEDFCGAEQTVEVQVHEEVIEEEQIDEEPRDCDQNETEEIVIEAYLEELSISAEVKSEEGSPTPSLITPDEEPNPLTPQELNPPSPKEDPIRKQLPTRRSKVDTKKSVPEITSFKYKSCCQHKPSHSPFLPKYDGDICEYGLSRKQLHLKMIRGERQQRHRQEVAFRKYEQEMQRARANEEAFERWVRQKMTTVPKNKYANRYDSPVAGVPTSKTAAQRKKRK